MIRMNKLPQVIIGIVITAASIGFIRCSDKKEEKSNQLRAFEKLSAHTWKIKLVKEDGKDVTSEFKDMTIAFSDNTYIASNGTSIWPAQDTWKFSDPDASVIQRGDQLVISVRELSEVSLIISLQWGHPGLGPGRINSIQGAYIFAFE